MSVWPALSLRGERCHPALWCVQITVLATSAAFSPAASAAWRWSNEKSLQLGLTFTDNTALVANDPQASTIGNLRPEWEISGQGRQSSLRFVLGADALQNLDTGENSIAPDLLGAFSTTPRGGPFSFDASALLRALPAGDTRSAGDLVNSTGDTRTASTLEVSPSLEQALGSTMQVNGRYRLRGVTVSGGQGNDDSVAHQVEAGVRRNASDGDLQLGVVAQFDRTEFEQDIAFEQRSLVADIAMPVGQAWLFAGSVGREQITSSDMGSDTSPLSRELSGLDDGSTVWDVEATYTPYRNTVIAAGYGERFFGRSPHARISHSTRRSTISLLWNRGVTRVNGRLIAAGGTGDVPATPLSSVGTDPLTDGLTTLNPAGQLAVEEQVSVIYELRGRASTLTLTGLRASRDDNGADADATGDGGEQLATTMRDDPIVSWQFRSTLERELTPRLSWQLEYIFNKEEASSRREGYVENRVGVSARYEF